MFDGRRQGDEVSWLRRARAAYYRRRNWLLAIEARIQMTDAGLAWLGRVKQIGRAA